MRTTHTWRALASAAALSLGVAACGGGSGGSGAEGGDGLSGSIIVDGSSTVAPLSEAVAEEFNAEQPDVQVSVASSGTGGGFKKFCAGEVEIAGASRPIKAEEAAACEKAGLAFTEMRVGLDGLAVVTSAKNTFLECLSFDQLAKIWAAGGATTWDQVDPKFPKEKIAIFAPGTDSGTYDFFTEEVLGDPDDAATPKVRTDYTASEDDNVLVQGLEGETNSWGFFGFAYYQENEEGLKAIEIAKEGGDCVAPATETIEDGSYPLSRPLFIYVRNSELARPEVAEFVRFYLEVTPDVVGDVGYVAAPKADYSKALEDLEAATES